MCMYIRGLSETNRCGRLGGMQVAPAEELKKVGASPGGVTWARAFLRPDRVVKEGHIGCPCFGIPLDAPPQEF